MVQINLLQRVIYGAARRIQRDTAYNEYTSLYFPIRNSRNPQRKADIHTLRRLSKTPIARAAINQIKDGVCSLSWHIVPVDDKVHKQEIDMVTRLIKRPNQIDSYKSMLKQLLEDMLVLDMGCFEKKKVTSGYQPLYLFPIDAGTVKVIPEWQGDPKEYRYAQDVHGKETFFYDSQIAVIRKNEFTYTWQGLSPTEQAWKHIQYLVNCQEYANTVASDSMPKYLVNLGEKAGESELQRFREYIENDVQGQSTLGIVGTAKLEAAQTSPIGDDTACLSWQKMLLQIISVCYRVPPERLGSAISNDRSTTADQEEDFTENTIKPWAALIEEAINKHVIELLGLQDKVRFEFIYLPTQAQKTILKDTVTALVDRDIITLNEARQALKGVLSIDLPDVKNGDVSMSEYRARLSPVQTTNTGQDSNSDKGGDGNG